MGYSEVGVAVGSGIWVGAGVEVAVGISVGAAVFVSVGSGVAVSVGTGVAVSAGMVLVGCIVSVGVGTASGVQAASKRKTRINDNRKWIFKSSPIFFMGDGKSQGLYHKNSCSFSFLRQF
jgi:hypothetical protein